jgi:hypothetical protein
LQGIKELVYLKFILGFSYLCDIGANIAFFGIAYTGNIDYGLLMFGIWGVLCSVSCIILPPSFVYAINVTNSFLDKSLQTASGGTGGTRDGILALKKKNITMMYLMAFIIPVAPTVFFIPILIPALLRSLDLIIMFWASLSAIILLSSLRYFK